MHKASPGKCFCRGAIFFFDFLIIETPAEIENVAPPALTCHRSEDLAGVDDQRSEDLPGCHVIGKCINQVVETLTDVSLTGRQTNKCTGSSTDQHGQRGTNSVPS